MNEKENHLPNLSDKERAHALELAMKARKRRAVLKARMKSGELAFTDGVLQRHGEFAEHGICGSYLEKADAREGRYPTSCRASIRCRKHVGWRAGYEGTLSSFLPFRESERIQRETSCLDRA